MLVFLVFGCSDSDPEPVPPPGVMPPTGIITCKVDEKVIFGIVKEVFLQDLGKEDELDREVQEILEKHRKLPQAYDIPAQHH